jgi:hypothetical protein
VAEKLLNVLVQSVLIGGVVEKDAEDQVIRLATTSIGNTVVVHTLPLVAPKDGYTLLSSSAVATQTAISILLSLIAVVAFVQVILVTRGGLTALEGINGLFPPVPGVHAQSPLIFNH